MSTSSAKKIVIIRSGALGDCVVSTPMLRLVRSHFPESQITVIGDPYSVPILAHSPHIDRLLPLAHHKEKRKYISKLLELRREKFDLLIDVQCCGRSRVQSLVIGAKTRIGFDKGHTLANFPYTRLAPYDRSVHAVTRILRIAEYAGVATAGQDQRLEIAVKHEHRRQAAEFLKAHGIGERFAILQATTGPRPENRVWPTASFAEVASHLSKRGIPPVITGPSAQGPVHELLRASCVPIVSLDGMTEPLVLAAIIEQATIYVGYNTGPMHIAAAVGTPMVALFDVPTDYEEWRPWTSAHHRVLRASESPEDKNWHIANIAPAQVCESIDEVLDLARSNRTPFLDPNPELMPTSAQRQR